MAGRAVPACRARAFLCPSVRAWRMARREGGRSTTTPLPRMRTYVHGRTCVLSTQPQEARLERPSSPPRGRPASSEQAHRASSVGSHLEEGGAPSTATEIHVRTYIRVVLSWVVAPTCAMYPASLVLVRLALTELTTQQRTWTGREGGRGGAPSLQLNGSEILKFCLELSNLPSPQVEEQHGSCPRLKPLMIEQLSPTVDRI